MNFISIKDGLIVNTKPKPQKQKYSFNSKINKKNKTGKRSSSSIKLGNQYNKFKYK
jgi:hypothetical protein